MFKILYCLSVVLAESFVIIAVLFLFVNNFFYFFQSFLFQNFYLFCNPFCWLELLYLTILCNPCQLLFLLFYFPKYAVLTFCNCYILSLLLFFVNYFFYFFVFPNNWQKIKRRRRDLNPRAGYPTYTLSRGTSSATWVLLQSSLWYFILNCHAPQRKSYSTIILRICQYVFLNFFHFLSSFNLFSTVCLF